MTAVATTATIRTPIRIWFARGAKKIIDPDLESLKVVTRELTEETGFKILNHRLDFFGLCPACQKGASSVAD